MPIKVRSTFKKQEFEYESPDGEKWLINYVENEGRKYVSIGKEDQDAKEYTTWDVPMLLDIADQIRGMTSRVPQNKPMAKTRLKSPSVYDHRHEGLDRSNQIEADVETSMNNYDDTTSPIESFSPARNDEWFGVRTGVNPSVAAQSVGETPEDLKQVVEAPDWVDRPRARGPRPNIVRGARGGSGDGQFKRVGAGDII